MKKSPIKNIILPLGLSVLALYISSCALIPDQPPEPTSTPTPPPSGYEPQPGDNKLQRDQVFIEMENSSLVVRESYPVQVSVTLYGSLPDPCHQLRVVVSPPNDQRVVNLDVYSLFDPNMACIMVIKPFEVTIPLGSFTGGHFSVFVNGQQLGEFDA